MTYLSEDDNDRKEFPMAEGLLDYFPNALAYVAKISKYGNDKHNPGQKMHWSRWNSTDHANKIIRHLVDRGSFDSAGYRHSGYAAWRALALLQEEIEQDEDRPISRASRAAPAEAIEPGKTGQTLWCSPNGNWFWKDDICGRADDREAELQFPGFPHGDGKTPT